MNRGPKGKENLGFTKSHELNELSKMIQYILLRFGERGSGYMIIDNDQDSGAAMTLRTKASLINRSITQGFSIRYCSYQLKKNGN